MGDLQNAPTIKVFVLTVDFPSEPYGFFVGKSVNPLLDKYTHFAIIDSDIIVEGDFHKLPLEYSDADIIGVHVIPTSRIYRLWESLTFWVRLGPRIRGCAMILSSDFLKRVGGYPELPFACDTWLLQRSKKSIVSRVKVFHHQPFSLSHAIRRQIRDGQSRSVLRYPSWRTILHSIFRLRPLVLTSYIYYQMVGHPGETMFSRRWSKRAKSPPAFRQLPSDCD